MRVNIGPYWEGDEAPPDDFDRDIKICIDDYDVWNMDSTLAMIVHPMLIKLKKDKQGFPCAIPDDDIMNNPVLEEEYYAEKHKEWQAILDKMIWSFEQLTLDHYGEDQCYSYDKPEDDTKRTFQECLNAFTWDREGLKRHNEKIQEGLELFGKYFRSLWT
jgi:hypothetical protein